MTDPARKRSDDLDTVLRELRSDLSKGLAAVKIILDERSVRVERMDRELSAAKDEIVELKTKIAVLEERTQNQKEVSGQFQTTTLHEHIQDLRADKKSRTEYWKAAAPIVVAFVSGVFALVVAVVNMVLHFMESK